MNAEVMDPEVAQSSVLQWIINSLGALYLVVLPLAGLLTFVLAILVVWRGRGPFAVAALILIVNIPLLIGIFAAIQGVMSSYTVIAMGDVSPRPSVVAEGISTALVAPLVAILLMVPGYAVAAVGALVRCLSDPPEPPGATSRG